MLQTLCSQQHLLRSLNGSSHEKYTKSLLEQYALQPTEPTTVLVFYTAPHNKSCAYSAYLRRMLCSQAPTSCSRHWSAGWLLCTGTSSTACLGSPREGSAWLLPPACPSSCALVLPTFADQNTSGLPSCSGVPGNTACALACVCLEGLQPHVQLGLIVIDYQLAVNTLSHGDVGSESACTWW